MNKFFEHKLSIFNQEWSKLLPNHLDVITNNGHFKLKKGQLTINSDLFQISYSHKNGKGEPDNLNIDIFSVKVNDSTKQNPDNLKLNVNITYGDAMMSEFSIEYPNIVNVYHYNGKGSMFDKESFFGFSDESILDLIKFFNTFGYKLNTKDFLFIDKKNDDFSKIIRK